MVRVWHPELIPTLDDNRLPAAHVEVHMILGALDRGGGAWWLHPATQAEWQREPQLRGMHDLIVREMLTRGFDHKSPLEGLRRGYAMGIPDENLDQMLAQDKADLARKWAAEGRDYTQAVAPIPLGTAIVRRSEDRLKPDDQVVRRARSGALIVGFRPARSPLEIFWHDVEPWQRLAPQREWTKEQSAELRATTAHRSPL